MIPFVSILPPIQPFSVLMSNSLRGNVDIHHAFTYDETTTGAKKSVGIAAKQTGEEVDRAGKSIFTLILVTQKLNTSPSTLRSYLGMRRGKLAI